MTTEICECGHKLDDHDFDDLFCLGCSLCNCEEYVEVDTDVQDN